MIEYITNIYIFPLIGVILGLIIYHLHNRQNDKNYTTKGDYFKCAMLLYLVCFVILFLQKNMTYITINKSPEIVDISSMDLDTDNIFNIGHPSF